MVDNDNKKSKDELFDILNCGLGKNESSHLCEDPIQLSCGHCICKRCFFLLNVDKRIRCNTCNQINERDISTTLVPFEAHTFKNVLKSNLDALFGLFYEEFSKKIEYLRNIESTSENTIDLRIQFIKEEIEIRIETLKIELEKLNELLNQDLDNIKKDWTNEFANINSKQSDIKQNLNQEFEKFTNELNEKQNLNEENLYVYQKKIKELNGIIRKYEDCMPSLEFQASSFELQQNFIGSVEYNIKDHGFIHTQIMKRLNENKWENINLDATETPYDICMLSNNKMLITDHTNGKLLLYDNDMRLDRTIDSVGGETYNITGLDTDNRNAIFLSANSQNAIIKVDLEFNELVKFGGTLGNGANNLDHPYGICYYDENVFVCDFVNKRIVKLSQNLVYVNSYPLNYSPRYIKIIGNVACVRPMSLRSSLYFYNTSNFIELRKYDGHNGIIGASSLYFYEYYFENNTIYCYNNQGELIEQVVTNFEGRYYSVGGTICLYNSRLLICTNSNILIRI